ncbi:MAG TPA: hypothetical protein VGF08_07445, partial [Terriglobales bacterium]
MARILHYVLAVFCLAATPVAQQQESPLPALPADIPKDAVLRMLLVDKTPSGQDAVWRTPDGVIHEFFQFNDRGRGPKIYSTYHLDRDGLITSEESKGVDYMKTPVEERFAVTSGTATWKNQAEDEKQASAAGKFYIDINGGPETGAILARALLSAKDGASLPVLPSGEARIRKMQSLPVEVNGKKQTATLYEVSGLGFTPNYLWLDDDREFLANIGGPDALVQQGLESAVPSLRDSQRQVEVARAAELARKLTRKPGGDLVISNVSLFDAESAKL